MKMHKSGEAPDTTKQPIKCRDTGREETRKHIVTADGVPAVVGIMYKWNHYCSSAQRRGSIRGRHQRPETQSKMKTRLGLWSDCREQKKNAKKKLLGPEL